MRWLLESLPANPSCFISVCVLQYSHARATAHTFHGLLQHFLPARGNLPQADVLEPISCGAGFRIRAQSATLPQRRRRMQALPPDAESPPRMGNKRPPARDSLRQGAEHKARNACTFRSHKILPFFPRGTSAHPIRPVRNPKNLSPIPCGRNAGIRAVLRRN